MTQKSVAMLKLLQIKLLVSIFLSLLFVESTKAALPSTTPTGEPFPSLAPMIKRVNPAVVNISTYSTQRHAYNPLLNDPFFRRFFEIPRSQQYEQRQRKKQQSAGSGVIIDAQLGIVITNLHVVKGADEVRVSLADGRSVQASFLGADSEIDIAVLQIQAENLVGIESADSDQLAVGDFVVAIGNPFGLGQTVTTGVVSALGRSGLGIQGYENFIQTDASINPGNSGGALVNLAGELVGINTAIIAPSGGNVGIGFAIPINMASASAKQIITKGEVRRGDFGIDVQDIDPNLALALNLSAGTKGALVTNVDRDSVGDQAGLRPGDVITQLDDKVITSTSQFLNQLGIRLIGDVVNVTFLRDGEAINTLIEVEDPAKRLGATASLHPLLKGLEVSSAANQSGLVITKLAPNSAAAYSGLRLGDTIYGVNRRRVDSFESFKRAVQSSRDSILFQIARNGRSFLVIVRR